jgi:shikimate dehydrogenase
MHNAAFQAKGIDAVYVAFAVEHLAAAVSGLRGLSIGGVSVTMPFKEEIIALLDEIDPPAAAMGAINTVVKRESRLLGFNTDYLGAITALRQYTEVAGQHFLLVGAGGAGRAIAFGISQAGGRVTIADLDYRRSQELAQSLGCQALPLADLAHSGAGHLINATAVGMHPNIEQMPVPAEILPRFDVVMDIVYQPLNTRLLQEAARRGCRTIDGLHMLVFQGAVQFEYFTGQPAPVEVMRQAALERVGRGQKAVISNR